MSHPAYERKYELRSFARQELERALKKFRRSVAIAVVYGNFSDAVTFDEVVKMAREIKPA